MTNHIKIYGVKPRIQYVSNGNLKKYEFPFVIFKTSDVDVYLDDKLLTTSEYEVSVEPDIEGGTISFKVAPSNGTVITIARNLSIERTTDFQEGGALRANVLNDELDYQIACQQQIADNLNRSMVLPPYAVDTGVDLTLPTPSAGKAIVWNADGTNLENSAVKVNELESTLKGYKTEAQNAAMTAINKADIATTQAQTATTQAEVASTQAQIATEKAQEAVSTLASKANKDMDNLTTAGKNLITSLGMPDYTTGIGFPGNSWTLAPYDCFVTGGDDGSSANPSSSIQVNLTPSETGIVNVAYNGMGSSILGAFIPKGYYFRVGVPNNHATHHTVYCKLKGV